MNLTWFHGMKQNEHHGSWLSVVKNSWKSDKQLRCWDCFRAKSSYNSCLFWPLIGPILFFFSFFFKAGGNTIFFKREYRLIISEVRKNACPTTIVVSWLLWQLDWRVFLLFFFTRNAQTQTALVRRKSKSRSSLILEKELCSSYLQRTTTFELSV